MDTTLRQKLISCSLTESLGAGTNPYKTQPLPEAPEAVLFQLPDTTGNNFPNTFQVEI